MGRAGEGCKELCTCRKMPAGRPLYRLRTPSSLTIFAAKGRKDRLLAFPEDEAKFILQMAARVNI